MSGATHFPALRKSVTNLTLKVTICVMKIRLPTTTKSNTVNFSIGIEIVASHHSKL